MKKKVCILDIGGVVTHNAWPEAVHRFAEELGITPDQFEATDPRNFVAFQRGAISEKKFWRNLCDELGCDVPTMNGTSLWEKVLTETLMINPIMVGTVRRLKDNGYKVGLLSNIEPPSIKPFESLGCHGLFDARVYSCDVGHVKPEPAIYLLACEKLSADPANAIFIDDRLEHVEGARAVGITAHQFTSEIQARWFIASELDVKL